MTPCYEINAPRGEIGQVLQNGCIRRPAGWYSLIWIWHTIVRNVLGV